jgi:hypothetical protein
VPALRRIQSQKRLRPNGEDGIRLRPVLGLSRRQPLPCFFSVVTTKRKEKKNKKKKGIWVFYL